VGEVTITSLGSVRGEDFITKIFYNQSSMAALAAYLKSVTYLLSVKYNTTWQINGNLQGNLLLF
jgi:hypothetical protein